MKYYVYSNDISVEFIAYLWKPLSFDIQMCYWVIIARANFQNQLKRETQTDSKLQFFKIFLKCTSLNRKKKLPLMPVYDVLFWQFISILEIE